MTEQRNDAGYPCLDGPRTRPRASVRCEPGSAITGSLQVDQRTDNSVNPGLHWAAAFCGGGALFAVLVLAILKPWETADRAAQAELRAEFAQGIARTQALAELARKEASTAVDTVDNEVQRRKAREEIKP